MNLDLARVSWVATAVVCQCGVNAFMGRGLRGEGSNTLKWKMVQFSSLLTITQSLKMNFNMFVFCLKHLFLNIVYNKAFTIHTVDFKAVCTFCDSWQSANSLSMPVGTSQCRCMCLEPQTLHNKHVHEHEQHMCIYYRTLQKTYNA